LIDNSQNREILIPTPAAQLLSLSWNGVATAVSKKKILIVDDERECRAPMREYFEAREYEVAESSTAKAAEEMFVRSRPDAAILDYSLPDANALDLIPRLKNIDAGVPLVVVTGHGSIELAVQAMQDGAEHFVTKPVQLSALAMIVERLLENARNRRIKVATQSKEERDVANPFLGSSPLISKLAQDVNRVLDTDRPLLIAGETGSGKGVLASWIHRHSSRREEAFVNLNCAGLSRDFLETELFGHEKGAFTGAVSTKQGLFEVGHRGTVFLDEIGDVDPQVQPKLLKVLEEKQFRRLGSVQDRQVDVRLIAASHQNLTELVQQQRFRSDLYFRISTLHLRLPALRERPEDIPIIAAGLLQKCAAELGREVALLPDANHALMNYAWPGNIRELRNVLERAVLLSDKKELGAGDLRFDSIPIQGTSSGNGDLNRSLTDQERKHIQDVLRAQGWRVVKAAKILGLSRSSLYRKIKDFQIEIP
jgi:DNA-binding NtrC family response regulator